MFLALKNGLGRLAIFFRGLFDEYGGAAAAYSLRRLGSAYSGPLVRVRRDSDDAELDFTSTTSIEDWVNGKLETTLPADAATSSAAYSLRKVKADYTGNAVRIRRASDDVEVDVAFDGNGEVSASSAITNVTESPDQGDTTATTLGGFLTEGGNQDAYVHTWYDQSGSGNDATQDVSGDQPKIAEAGALLADGIDFDGADDKLNFTALSASDLSIFSVVTFDSVAGQERIIGPQTGNSEGFGISNATTGFFRGSGGTANSPALNATISADTATLYSLIRASNTGTFFTDSTASATFSNTDTFAGASLGGATNPVDGSLKEIIIYTSDQSSNRFKIESNINNHYGIYTASHNGFVSIWYDQSGNGTNATQSSLPEQPKIVQSGVLVTTLGEPSINFAVGQLLFTDSLIVSLSTNSASVFAVSSQSSLSTTTSYVLQEPDSNISSNFIMGGVANGGVLWVNATEFGTMQTGQTLSGFDWNQSTFQAHINGAASGASGTATVNAEFGSRTGIGGFGGGVGRFQGFMQEIITYKSDQSANRSGIESNIAEHYGITLP